MIIFVNQQKLLTNKNIFALIDKFVMYKYKFN